MWKLISLTLVIFLVTISCANQGATNAPSPSVASDEAANTTSLGSHFPQKINTPNVYLDTPWIEGELVLENGCLRVSGVENILTGGSFLLIWDSRFSTRMEQGVVQVIDNSTGKVLASVGDFVAISGGGTGTNPKELDLKESIPDECPGPYYHVGESIKKIDRPYAASNEAANTPSLGAHFPQLITHQNVHLEALINGKLVLENGCLRMSGVAGAVNGSTFLLIWDQRFSTRTEQGVVQVIDKDTGEVLASVGDFVAVGGGFVGNPTSRGLKESIPDECPGSYFLVGESIKKIERPSLGAHFPQLNNPQSTSARTAIKGKLVLENGCLRINNTNEAGNSVLLIWHLTVSTRAEQGVVQVIDSETGKVLVGMDDFVAVEGGFIDDPTSWGLMEPLPSECPGPYFLVGESIKKIDRP